MSKNGTTLDWALQKTVPEPMSGCWLWEGSVDKDGYGKFYLSAETSHTGRKNSVRAHRFIYEELRGKIPDGLVTDHKCRVRSCCNPDHIEIVTTQENTKRGNSGKSSIEKGLARTHCKWGHELVGKNVRQRGNQRYCRVCAKRRIDEYLERNKYHGG